MARRTPSNTNQTFTYIQSMLTEMRILSKKENAPMLAYLIEMAIIEADNLAQGGQTGHPDPNDTTTRTTRLVETAV